MQTDRLPLVSLVIPVKDEGRYIEGCLESIAAQDRIEQLLSELHGPAPHDDDDGS